MCEHCDGHPTPCRGKLNDGISLGVLPAGEDGAASEAMHPVLEWPRTGQLAWQKLDSRKREIAAQRGKTEELDQDATV